jgi:hypothetical protein
MRKELHNLCSSPNIITQIKTEKNEAGEACGTHGRWHKSVQGLVERDHSEDRGEDESGITMDLREISWGGGGVDSVGSG